MEGLEEEGRRSADRARLDTVTILGDRIHSQASNYAVNCHQIKIRFKSALIFTVTATCEGLFARLEWSLCLLGAIIIVLHSFLAQYFKPSNAYIFSFLVDIPLWPS